MIVKRIFKMLKVFIPLKCELLYINLLIYKWLYLVKYE